ncbi:uncharacterized protein LTR77_005774 [Saxophila tyrrhenica]|uniref:Uncharacterized protein n=1 Tax=Saxophila tyrrhenica TaxID=1690608 RepID=A0AAV9P9P0_9PEZI|nr:hypothetical protein LTR77_005774 [Saxophila tyrrhenica]
MLSKTLPLALYAAAASTLVTASPVSINARSLQKRTAVTELKCGLWATADEADTEQNWENFVISVEGESAGPVAVPANSCSRIGCSNTSGVYVCNDQDSDIELDMGDITPVMKGLMDTCGYHDDKTYEVPISGQIFVDANGGYNLNIAYCNGNDATNIGPSAYSAPGPNGDPHQNTSCGVGGAPCSYGTCDADSITVESQESVTCDEYLAPTYIGAGATYTYSTTRTISYAWSVGGFLGINIGDLSGPVGVAGFSATFTETTTVGTISGTSDQCGSYIGQNGQPGNWTCALDIKPKCWQMTGTCEADFGDLGSGTAPWAVSAPQIEPGDGQSVWVPNLCVCYDCEGWAEGGAPQDACPLDCRTCATPGSDSTAGKLRF